MKSQEAAGQPYTDRRMRGGAPHRPRQQLQLEIAVVVALSIGACLAPLLPVTAANLVVRHDALTLLIVAATALAGLIVLLRMAGWVWPTLLYGAAATLCFAAGGTGVIAGRLTEEVSPEVLANFLYIFFDSNWQEAADFIRAYAGPADLTWLALLLLVVLAAAAMLRQGDDIPRRRRLVAGAILLLVSGLMIATSGGAVRRVLSPIAQARAQHRADMAAMANYASALGQADVVVSRSRHLELTPETYVVVIGESTTRHNLQIYGYTRPTTPNLVAMRRDLLVFGDAVAPHSHTIPVLKKLLTFADAERPEAWRGAPDLLTIFRKAGFKTWWLSNQLVFGSYDTWTTAFASRADTANFSSIGSRTNPPHDDVLFVPFERALADDASKKLIVVHLMGTHLPAARRYPKMRAPFTARSPLPESYAHVRNADDRDAIDEYDNAVHFNDYVVSHLLTTLRRRALDARAAFIYVSDHGEEVKHVDSYLGHGEFRWSPYMLEIPLIAWVSPAFGDMLSRPGIEDRPVGTDQLIHTILDLADIQTPGFRPERSVFAVTYEPPPRRVADRNYDLWRKGWTREESRTLHPAGQRDFPSRIWAHRVNSTTRLATLIDDFGGFEIDLVFDVEAGTFDVHHPPEPPSGLSLDEYFSSHANVPQRQFWLDIKNLEAGNANKMLASLLATATRFGLRSGLIVESPRVDLLTAFTDAGFYTSYYLPLVHEFDSPSDWLVHVTRELAGARVNAISTNGMDYAHLKDSFPGYDRLLWEIDPRLVLDDSNVKVVLVTRH